MKKVESLSNNLCDFSKLLSDLVKIKKNKPLKADIKVNPFNIYKDSIDNVVKSLNNIINDLRNIDVSGDPGIDSCVDAAIIEAKTCIGNLYSIYVLLNLGEGIKC